MLMYEDYFLPSLEELEFFCFPHSVGKYSQPLDHNVTREHGVKDFSLHFVVNGKGYIEVDDTVLTLKKGDAFFHSPHQRMRYYTDSEDRWEVYWLQFNGKQLADFLLERGFHGSSVWYINNAERLEESFQELLQETKQHNFLRPAKISSLTYAILMEFILGAVPFVSRKGAHNIDKIIAILPLMQQHAHEDYVLEEWADKLQLTPNYFCSLFKKVTRMTPLAYITKCRIQRSKQLLLNHPEKAIKEIAIDCGYPSISYFNKIFSRYEGMTPSQFRSNHWRS